MFLTNFHGAADQSMKPNREWLEKIRQKDSTKAETIASRLASNEEIRRRERDLPRT